MRQVCIVVLIIILSLSAAPQSDTPKPKVSKDALTAEQIAVYRTVIADYMKGFKGSLNLASVTDPLAQSRLEAACFKGINTEPSGTSPSVVHRFDPSMALSPLIVLVDPEQQQMAIEENDPQNIVKKAIDDHEAVTDKQLDKSIKKAFDDGLFTLSEIAFDNQHKQAVVAYSFVCGALCGHGNTLVLKRVPSGWKVTKRCGGWIS